MIVDKARLHAAAAMKAIEPTNRIYNVVSELMSQIRANVIKELEDQGHVLSGSLINSIETKTGIYSNKIRGVLSMNMYGKIGRASCREREKSIVIGRTLEK